LLRALPVARLVERWVAGWMAEIGRQPAAQRSSTQKVQ